MQGPGRTLFRTCEWGLLEFLGEVDVKRPTVMSESLHQERNITLALDERHAVGDSGEAERPITTPSPTRAQDGGATVRADKIFGEPT